MRFLLLDRIVEHVSGQRAVGLKNVTLSEDFFAHHFPERPVMPGTLMLECLIQVGDQIVRESTQFNRMGLLESVDRLKLRRLVNPGDQLLLEVKVTEQTDERVACAGQVCTNDATVASAMFSLKLCPLEIYDVRDEAERFFKWLTQQQ